MRDFIIFRVTYPDGDTYEFGSPMDNTFIDCPNRDFELGSIESAEIIGTYSE
jgi:hypothetical protein